MADTSHLPREVLYALRTGELPPHLLKSHHEIADEPEESVEDDPERFRRRYHAMVEEQIADWLDENPGYGRSIPAHERKRIEEYCELQIQHQWRMFTRTRDGLDDQDDGEWRSR